MANNVQSWLRPLLKQIDYSSRSLSTHEGNVVDLPNGTERLRAAIKHHQKELEDIREERAAYDEAWKAAQMEMQAAYDKNDVRTRTVESTLYKLRCEWMNETETLGMDAQIRRPELPPMEAENEP